MQTHKEINSNASKHNSFAHHFQPRSTPTQFRKGAAWVVLALFGCTSLLLAAIPSATAQDPRGKPVSITSESTPFGMSLFRLWSNGDIEVMVLGQDNVWSDWKAVASGKGGYAPGGKPSE